ncbi:MAG: prolipoprotein diacylglyceryl transferase [Lactobacillaceae bacterium]|jgi:phosphatidylglycerol:prolipoprotein diacylglycerol transferase|nr:prolipoprotein diacylglyceryl transferase [Lactobacillaceae bacterium]
MIGLAFPNISPEIFSIGFFSVRWYSMAYLLGILFAWFMVKRNVKKYDWGLTDENLSDLAFYATMGMVAGGRLGYVLFYGGEPNPFWENPALILQLWKGGMSFHGGIAGVIFAVLWYSYKIKYPFLKIMDIIAPFAPIGLFLGRLTNFINDELWGRVTTVPWAVRFPNGGYLPRHPSQLYEAMLEGVVMFLILNILWNIKWTREKTGFISGTFAILYTLFRVIVEQYREPDAHIGFVLGSMTMGQLLSVPLILAGIWAIYKSFKTKPE